jgi:hypothetical protein
VSLASASPRLFLGLALAATVGAGIGLGVASVGSSSGPAAPPALHALTAAASTLNAPATAASLASAPAPLTVDQAKAVALQASAGTVVDVQRENGAAEASDPTEATDPTDPTEATDTTEPPGPSYDVTVQHQDGTTTEVVVDATTGHVVSTQVDDNRDGD